MSRGADTGSGFACPGLPVNGFVYGSAEDTAAALLEQLKSGLPEVTWQLCGELSSMVQREGCAAPDGRDVLVMALDLSTDKALHGIRLVSAGGFGPPLVVVAVGGTEHGEAALAAGADEVLAGEGPDGPVLRPVLARARQRFQVRNGEAVERVLLRALAGGDGLHSFEALLAGVPEALWARFRLDAVLMWHPSGGVVRWGVRRASLFEPAGTSDEAAPSEIADALLGVLRGAGGEGAAGDPVARVAASGGGVLLRAEDSAPEPFLGALAALGLGGSEGEVVLLPLSVRGRNLGALCVRAQRPGALFVQRVEALVRTAPLLAARLARLECAARDETLMARARLLVDVLNSFTFAVGPSGALLEPDPAWERFTGRPYETTREPGAWLAAFHEEDREAVKQVFHGGQTGGVAREVRLWHADSGDYRFVTVRAVPTADGTHKGYIVAVTDVHEEVCARQERESLEAQLRQAQRMEAVGRLAGGVAHDLNNLLTVIQGNSYLLSSVALDHPELSEEVRGIEDAARRASELTGRLLLLSRRTSVQPQVLDLNAVVEDLEPMLRRVIEEDVDLHFHYGEGLPAVEADPVQLEQVLLNLIVNARDAMPGGGVVTVETAAVELGESLARVQLVGRPGLHAMLAVTDTGVGMDAETQARIFDPFFTTKAKGKGTGLGLATVYSVVKQGGGHIYVQSAPGAGTTFKVYFPAVRDDSEERPEAARADPGPRRPPTVQLGGSETVLVAEDEEVVRNMVRRVLEQAGYRVLLAAHGEEALALAESHEGRIDVLITDVVMPRLSGPDLARRMAETRPDCSAIYMSGYADHAVVDRGALSREATFLAKPFTPRQLLLAVRHALDGKGR